MKIVEKEGKRETGSSGYTGDLSKWWRSKSAQSAIRRATKTKKERLKTLRKLVKQKKGNNSK